MTAHFKYCTQHLAIHESDWCTVDEKDKIVLSATTLEDARKECAEKELILYTAVK